MTTGPVAGCQTSCCQSADPRQKSRRRPCWSHHQTSNCRFCVSRMPLLNSTIAQHFLQSGFGRDANSLSENRGGEKAIADGRNDRSLMTSNELIVQSIKIALEIAICAHLFGGVSKHCMGSLRISRRHRRGTLGAARLSM